MLEGSQINQYDHTLKLFFEQKRSLLQRGIPLIWYYCVLFEHFRLDELFKGSGNITEGSYRVRVSLKALVGSWKRLGAAWGVSGRPWGVWIASWMCRGGVLESFGSILRPTWIILEGSWGVLRAFQEPQGRPGPSFRRVWSRFWIVFVCFFEVWSQSRELVKIFIFFR